MGCVKPFNCDSLLLSEYDLRVGLIGDYPDQGLCNNADPLLLNIGLCPEKVPYAYMSLQTQLSQNAMYGIYLGECRQAHHICVY